MNQDKINAFHSNWTKPFFTRNRDMEYFIEDFEILTTILSALEWRKHNGSIKMYTDDIGQQYYHKLGIAHIWDLGINTDVLNLIPQQVDPFLFWAAGKLFALKADSSPCVMLDTDFIVWKNIISDLKNTALSTIHRENINAYVYPDKFTFHMKKQYCFPLEWDWTVKPCNTALAYFAYNDFKQYYTDCSIDFMLNLKDGNSVITNMVFAEQRIIAMCAKAKGIEINSLIALDEKIIANQDSFTHTWGFKEALRSNPQTRKDFCIDCIKRILSDFPEEQETIANIKPLRQYYNEVI